MNYLEATTLKVNEVRSFTKKRGLPQERALNKAISICLKDKENIVALAQFSFPDKKDSNIYSSELKSLILDQDYSNSDSIALILNKYIKDHHPADFFIRLKSDQKLSKSLSEFGMLLVKDTKETEDTTLLEWIDPERTYYTYKVSSKNSRKYYIGVSHVKKAKASIEDCINDGYWGSGGVKYKNWRIKNTDSLKKEILGRFERKSPAFSQEKDIIGDLWKTDKNCLNSLPGGYGDVITKNISVSIKVCDIHGEVKHRGDRCYTCVNQNAVYKDTCEIHGETKFRAKSCIKCSLYKKEKIEFCEVHGLTLFYKTNCRKCSMSKINSIKECEIHGKVNFIKDKCRKCTSIKSFYKDDCEAHGLTTFKANRCQKCKYEESNTLKKCEKHGKTSHIGNSCRKCISESVISFKECSIHGFVKFNGNSCNTCNVSKVFSEGKCSKHGLASFRGDKCDKCSSQNAIKIKICPTHGETKFQGNTCSKCAMSKRRRRKDRLYLTINKDAVKFWSDKNKEDINNVGLKSSKIFIWECTNGFPHTFNKSANSFINKNDCLVCSGDQFLKGFNELSIMYPDLSSQWSNNNKLKSSEVTCKTKGEFLWVDSLGHEWPAKISTRLNNRGCPYCASQKVLRGFNHIFSMHPELERFWNFEKNQKINPTEITKGSNKSVWWICKLGHEEFLSPKMFLRNLCRECKSINNPRYGKTLKTLSKKS